MKRAKPNPRGALKARVAPRPIRGNESVRNLLDGAFPAFVGRRLRDAYRLMAHCLERRASVFATMAGAMTPAGLHSTCLVPLIETGAVSCLTTTGANLYHDAHRTLGHAIHEVSPDSDDRALRRERIIRIYDLGFDEDVLLQTDRFFAKILEREEMQRPMTTPELHWHLGKDLAAIEARARVESPSLLAACYRNGVPIFTGAPQDGSIFLNAVRVWRERAKRPGFAIDAAADVYAMAALQLLCQQEGGETAVWIFGGGVPKNYTLQGEPLLTQILDVKARGFDYDVQICVDVVDNGALSPCPAGEGHTWGKTSAECVESGSCYLRADMTVVLPWLVHGLVSQRPLRRRPPRLYDRLPEAVALLDRRTRKLVRG